MFGGNVRPSHKEKAIHDTTRGPGNLDPAPEAEGVAEGGGDGFHHHEIHENESGFHSVHTHPDGQVEHADHGSMDEAKDHMDRMMDHQDQGAANGGEEHLEKSENDDDQPDFSARYRS